MTWAGRMSASRVTAWSGTIGCADGDGLREHGLDGLLGHHDSLAEAEGGQAAGASHFVGEGTADAQELSSFFDCER